MSKRISKFVIKGTEKVREGTYKFDVDLGKTSIRVIVYPNKRMQVLGNDSVQWLQSDLTDAQQQKLLALVAKAERVVKEESLVVEESLPEDPWRYFVKTPGALLVPICIGNQDRPLCLHNIRARPKGIMNAAKYMRLAYEGKNKKRKPISLRLSRDGEFSIVDGNSTFAIAVANGWKHIPAEVDSSALIGLAKENRESMAATLEHAAFNACPACGTRLTEMSARELRQKLRKEGCIELRQKGSHLQVQCGKCQSTIPMHKGRDIKRGTLGAIERSLEVCLGDDFL
jgi:predicted RNA binding protein YcfA (HicA-like mRNA interferase family)